MDLTTSVKHKTIALFTRHKPTRVRPGLKLSRVSFCRVNTANPGSTCNLSQKSLATLRRKTSPRFPSFNVATMMSTFLSIFFWTCKTTLGRGYGGKGSHCPMLLSEIVWKSYVKYAVSFYVMWISTLFQSHGGAPPVQRWRCTILNKIITVATAVKLHGNRCSLNHVDMNL